MTTTSGSAARATGGAVSLWWPWRDLGRIELARGRGALAHELVGRGGLRRVAGIAAIALAGPARHGFGAAQPPQAETQHDRRGDDAEARGGKGRGAEERHRDRVLDRGRAGQRRHGEGEGAESDRRRHQPVRDVRRAEQGLGHGRQHEEARRTG